MTIENYLTETAAANYFGLTGGKGSAWRMMRGLGFEPVNLFGVLCIHKDDLPKIEKERVRQAAALELKRQRGREYRLIRTAVARVRSRRGEAPGIPTIPVRHCPRCRQRVKMTQWKEHMALHKEADALQDELAAVGLVKPRGN